jgi:hypothetical protein
MGEVYIVRKGISTKECHGINEPWGMYVRDDAIINGRLHRNQPRPWNDGQRYARIWSWNRESEHINDQRPLIDNGLGRCRT